MVHMLTTLLTLATGAPEMAPAAHALDVPPPAIEDDRWLPWIGCWEPTDAPAGDEGSELLVCFEPTEDGVRVLTLGDGDLLSEERIVADGTAFPAADGGCEGTREARWSEDGRRAFILSDLHCAEGVERTTRGVFAMARDGGEWIEIHGIRAAERESSMAVRAFRPASAASMVRHDHTPPPEDRGLAIRTSRMAAAAPLDREDLIEAVEVVGSDVTASLVAEVGEPWDLDARALRDLADAGVPGEVIDMVVAVSYPERFVVDAGEAQAAPPARSRSASAYGSPYNSSWRCSAWDRYCGSGSFMWAFGFPGWRSPSPYYWGYRSPRTVVIQPGPIRGGGTVSPGSGYRPARTNPRPARTRMDENSVVRQGLNAILGGLGSRGSRPTASDGGSRVDPDGGHRTGGSDRRGARRSGGGDGDGDGST